MLSGKQLRLGAGSLLALSLLYFSIDSYSDIDSSDYLKKQIKELKTKISDSDDGLQNQNENLKSKVEKLKAKVEELEQTVSHINISENSISSEIYEFGFHEGFVVFPKDSFETRVWIDVPNSFPWRKCLHEWSENAITYGCDIAQEFENIRQSLYLKPLKDDQTKFQLMLTRDNPGRNIQCFEPNEEKHIRMVRSCSNSEFWRWSEEGLLVWGDLKGCLGSTGGQDQTILVTCDSTYDDQIVEIGELLEEGGEKVLLPFNMKFWEKRAKERRDNELQEAKKEVEKVLEEIHILEANKDFQNIQGQRRAVVFYVDKGGGFLSYLTWWIFTWRQIGLDSEEAAFDIVLMTHPKSVEKLPVNCTKVPEDYNPDIPGPGKCLYRELSPLSERDHRYDNYLNSQEALFNPSASFLLKYKVIIRADLDTFPTPGMLDLWPSDVICYRGAGTNHHKKSIEDAIVSASEAAGIQHHHWHDMDSAWMGPSLRIVTLAKLTTYLARFTRAHMFGPNTLCRCARCMKLPEECTWGKGIYAGTLLLYAQEIAMNRLWSEREYQDNANSILDAGTTDGSKHICEVALLHARHNSEPFSKFTFLRGEYSERNMSKMDITNLRDYAMYMAISSSGQGKDTSQALENYKAKEDGIPLNKLCRGKEDTPGKKWS